MRKQSILVLAMVFVVLQFSCASLFANPVTSEQAEVVVRGWLKADAQPLEAALGQEITNVETFTDEDGEPIHYVVYLQPCGFVIVSADDLIEPIIAFADDGTFDPSVDNPLGALVNQDLKGRVAMVRQLQQTKRLTPGETGTSTQSKWERLEGLAEESEEELLTMGLGSISDVRVAPLVKSKWNQQNICGSRACYNYYTPQWEWDTYPISGHAIWPEGNSNNYPCGCSATALAQLLRFHEHPNTNVGDWEFEIKVRGYIDENNFLEVTESRSIRGGNGSGGQYNWSLMDLTPDCSTTPAERQAIGALCYDASLVFETTYSEYGSLVSDANMSSIGPVFQLSNGIFGSNGGANIGAGLNGMVNPNLDANHPVALAISGTGELYGHAVLADGYGYNSSTLYHHLNLGWSGTDDAWYNLPTISAGGYSFDCVDGCFYNIFVTGTGEIISGRVTAPSGNPISGATVTAERDGGGTYNAMTSSKGIYALAKVPSASTYTISVTNTGYCFETHVVETGTSESLENTSGNLWGINFQSIVFHPDLDGDGFINFTDFPFLASNWMRDDCNVSNEWCDETDLCLSGNVDYLDLAVLCDNWLNDFSLVGHWTMDDDAANTTVVDSSGNGNDGTAQQNTEDINTTGVIDGALTFNGTSDYVNCGDDSSLDITDAITISAWVKFDSLPDFQSILVKRGAVTDTASNYALRTGNLANHDEVQFYYHDGSSWHVYTTSNANLTAGQWYHFVVTFTFGTGTSAKCYVNNNLLSGSWTLGNGNSPVQINTKPVTIGGLTSGERADGVIDNVMIFSRALSQEEIEELYDEGVGI